MLLGRLLAARAVHGVLRWLLIRRVVGIECRLLKLRLGKASIIAPLASLYPLVSVPIAITFLGEKISGRETVGIVIALVSVVALAWEKPTSTSSIP